jgi:hypothetical protein
LHPSPQTNAPQKNWIEGGDNGVWFITGIIIFYDVQVIHFDMCRGTIEEYLLIIVGVLSGTAGNLQEDEGGYIHMYIASQE